MSPPRIARSAAVAALALAASACSGEGSNKPGEKRELAPVPTAEPSTEPAKEDAYSKSPSPSDAAPVTPAPTPAPMPEPKVDEPKPMGDPLAAHREFEDAISARLKTIDGQITQLADKVKAATDDQRKALQETFDNLSAKRDEAATQFDQIRTIAADKWDTAKADLEKTVAALESSAAEALK